MGGPACWGALVLLAAFIQPMGLATYMTERLARRVALSGIVLFVAAVAFGPSFSHPAYSSIGHTTSELAGQNMPFAWIMRVGFAGYGLSAAVAALAIARSLPEVAAATIIFGVALIACAFWSHLPIDAALGGSLSEDRLHSAAAMTAGVAFTVGAMLHLRRTHLGADDWPSWLALCASIGLPLAMLALPAIDGILQRLMFGISFIWLWHILNQR